MNKLAFSRPTSGEAEFRQLLNTFMSIGYEGLQLKFGQYSPYLSEPDRFLDHVGAIAAEADMSLIVGCDLSEEGVALLRRTIQFASRLQSDLVIFCHARTRESVSGDDIKQFASILSDIGKEARQSGTALSLHHHFNQPVMYYDDLRLFFDHVDPMDVGLTVDTAHLVKSGVSDVSRVVHDFAHVINNFHFKDLNIENSEFKVLGEGDIDFEPIFSSMREVNYRGWISADEESGSGLMAGMGQCYDFISRNL